MKSASGIQKHFPGDSTNRHVRNALFYPDPGWMLHHLCWKHVLKPLDGSQADDINGAQFYQYAAPNDEPNFFEWDMVSSEQIEINSPQYSTELALRWYSHDRFIIGDGPTEGHFQEFKTEFLKVQNLVRKLISFILKTDHLHIQIERIGRLSSNTSNLDNTRVLFTVSIPVQSHWDLSGTVERHLDA